MLSIVVGWILAVFIGLLGAIILWRMWNNQINLSKLVSEPGGDASLSRFQFMIFTFVIAMGYFLITLQKGGSFPDIPPNVLALLGISAGSYVVSKGIQVQRDTRLADKKPETDAVKAVTTTQTIAVAPTNGTKPEEPIHTP